jgi:DNA-binding winged helix-turn-helix (wHTH) protein
MTYLPDFYDFAGMRFSFADSCIVIIESQKRIELTSIQKNFLQVLCKKAPGHASYEELWRDAWRSRRAMTPEDLHTIQVTKANLTAWLKHNNAPKIPIEAIAGKGYQINCPVTPGWKERPAELTDDEEETAESDLFRSSLRNGYLPSISFMYGALFGIALMMEVSYKFDVYGWRTLPFAVAMTLVNSVFSLAAIRAAYELLRRGKSYGLIVGIAIFMSAIAVSMTLSVIVLPLEPITRAQFQTQPAFSAFLKNALIYFLPLGIFFILMPFYHLSAKLFLRKKVILRLPSDAIQIRPFWLFMILIIAIIYSMSTTNFLLNSLTPGNYQYLFVVMIFLRFALVFGTGLVSTLWYRQSLDHL